MADSKLDLAARNPQELTRMASDIAGLCKAIVLKTAMQISGRSYVKVEGWQSIATAHGCVACSRDVEKVYERQLGKDVFIGYKCIGEIRRMTDGVVIGQAEGFIGVDEITWFGGEKEVMERGHPVMKMAPKRPDYAIRAMCQTRAISRACRAAFSHVVVLMNAGLSTMPAEEAEDETVQADMSERESAARGPEETGRPIDVETVGDPKQGAPGGGKKTWRDVEVFFGKNTGVRLGDLEENSLRWYCENFEVKETYPDCRSQTEKRCSPENLRKQEELRDALDEAVAEYNWSDAG